MKNFKLSIITTLLLTSLISFSCRQDNAKPISQDKEKPAIEETKSQLPISEKDVVGHWQAENGTIYKFFYNGYLQLYVPGQKMIDCQWGLINNSIRISAFGEVLLSFKNVSISENKMILLPEKGGKIILTKTN